MILIKSSSSNSKHYFITRKNIVIKAYITVIQFKRSFSLFIVIIHYKSQQNAGILNIFIIQLIFTLLMYFYFHCFFNINEEIFINLILFITDLWEKHFGIFFIKFVTNIYTTNVLTRKIYDLSVFFLDIFRESIIVFANVLLHMDDLHIWKNFKYKHFY